MATNTFRLFTLGAYLFLLMGCSHQEPETKSTIRPVKVFRVGYNHLESATSYAGEVRPRFETTLSFRVAGKIIARPVEVGDFVKKGQVLAKLDVSDFQLAVQALQAQIKSAVADRDFAKEDLNRYRELLTQKVISPPDFDRHQTVYTNAQERVAALEAQLKQTINQLQYTELAADRDGVVTTLAVEKGQVVAAGQPVVKLAQLDEKEIHFDIPEQRVADIKTEQQVDVTLWSDDKQKLKAKIREISATADSASRTYRAKATLLDGQEQARLGMTATVWVASDNNNNQIIAPLSAIFTSQDQPTQQKVWLVDEANQKVNAVPVQIGVALADELTTVTGLNAGQLIVSAGVQRLKDGQTVRLPEQKTLVSGVQP
ncbi:MAG: efflux RND transporter periplasmic adaptor subunit [Methylococcales bacterium]|nr:efflux RND transporter periplasmic adaptor subunit [Methylococcales bacterium]